MSVACASSTELGRQKAVQSHSRGKAPSSQGAMVAAAKLCADFDQILSFGTTTVHCGAETAEEKCQDEEEDLRAGRDLEGSESGSGGAQWVPMGADGCQWVLPHPTRSFSDCYGLGELLGSGSFADVWTCTEKATGKVVACKTVLKSSLVNAEKWENLQREILLMSALSGKHKGLVVLKEVLESERSVHMVMELCRGGDLYELLSAHGRMPEPAARMVFRQVASALAFCHINGILHRDIKPENILFDVPAQSLYRFTSPSDTPPAVHARLADFGLAVALRPGDKSSGTVGSRWYTAPELVQGKRYGRRIDVWSLGVVLCTMLSGKLPFAGKTHSDDEGLKRSILRGRINFKQPSWQGVSDDVKDLLSKMLQVEPSKRTTIAEVLRHPWVLEGAVPAPPVGQSNSS